MDNGMDEWTDGNEDESEDEEETRKGIYALPKKISRKRKSSPEEDSDQEPPPTDDAFSSPIKRPRVDDDTAVTVSVTDFDMSSDFYMSLDGIDMDAFMDDDLDFKTSVKKEEGDPVIIEIQDTLGPLTTSTPSMNSNNEADGSMRFFWLDYLELDGKL